MPENSGSNNVFSSSPPGQNMSPLNPTNSIDPRTLQEPGIFLDLSQLEIIEGQEGDDTIIGSRTLDTLVGNGGNDSFYGNQEQDSLQGNQGNDTIYGGADSDIIYGGKDNDFLRGDLTQDGLPLLEGFGDDIIFGGLGDDDINGNQGDDTLDGEGDNDSVGGGEGNDVAIGGSGNDFLDGEDGSDRLFGGTGNDTGSGGAGNDAIYGEDGDDLLEGELGNDLLDGGAGNDFLLGDDPETGIFGAGNDVLYGGTGDDTALGAAGNDAIFGNEGNDVLFGNQGADAIFGGQGIDLIRGGQDNDQLYGDLGDDLLYGDLGSDIVNGGEGNDFVLGNEGNDFVNGDEGNDTVFGNQGEDVVNGNAGNDLVYGGQGNDTVRGGQGDDQLFGDLGDDLLFGDLGNNTLTGGQGVDQFAISPGAGFLQATRNLITDYNDSEDFLLLADGVAFEDLDIREEVDANGTVNTILLDRVTGTVTILQNVSASAIERDDFLPTPAPPPPPPPVAPPELPVIPTPPNVTPPSPPAPPPPPPPPDAPGALQFSTATFRANEGAASQIVISRVGGTEGEVTVTVTQTGGTATAGTDFQGTFPQTITLADGVGSETVNLTVLEDGAVDANPVETVLLQLSNPTGGATLGGTTAATLEIVDIDNGGTIEFVQTSYTVEPEGGTATVEVRRVGGSSGAVTVPLTLAGGTATAGQDFNNDIPTQIQFADRDTATKTFTITGIDDTTIEGTETIQFSLGTPSGSATLGPQSSATVNILDDDIPTITISAADDEANEGDSTNTGQFVVSSDLPAPAGGITVNLAVAGTATQGTDYNAIGTTAVIPAGQTTVNIPVTITAGAPPAGQNDTDPEGPETVVVTVQAPTTATDYNVGPTPDNTATVNILDDDVPTVSISVANPVVAENNLAAASTLSVKLTGAISAPITVNLTTGGSATQGTDYTVSGTSVTFNPTDIGADGTATKTLTVTPLNDTEREPNEIATFRLAAPGAGDEYALDPEENNQSATVSVLDDESSQLLFGVADPLASEVGDNITGSLNISRFGGTANAITVNYQIDTTVTDAATPGVDYDTSTLPGFDPVTNRGTVTIPVGQDSIPITITPLNDGIAAGVANEALTEFITFNLLPGTGYEDPTSIPAATIQLINNGG